MPGTLFPSGRANGGGRIEVGETNSSLSQGVEMRCFDVRMARALQITVAQVITKDENDVGLLSRKRRRLFLRCDGGSRNERSGNKEERANHGQRMTKRQASRRNFSGDFERTALSLGHLSNSYQTRGNALGHTSHEPPFAEGGPHQHFYEVVLHAIHVRHTKV